MKWKSKWVNYLNIFLMTLFLTLVLPCRSQPQEIFSSQTFSQEVFPSQIPSQEPFQTTRDTRSSLRAGGGTGMGDSTEGGGGTDTPGYQNDTGVPITDALYLVVLLALGYGIYRIKKGHVKNKN